MTTEVTYHIQTCVYHIDKIASPWLEGSTEYPSYEDALKSLHEFRQLTERHRLPCAYRIIKRETRISVIEPETVGVPVSEGQDPEDPPSSGKVKL